MAEPWVSVGNFGRTVKERAARRPAQPARHQHTTGLLSKLQPLLFNNPAFLLLQSLFS